MSVSASVRLAVLTTAAILASCGLARAQEDYQVLKKFAAAEGGLLTTRMVRATDGNFYGATSGAGDGTGVFRLTPAGVYTRIATRDVPVRWGDPILASNGDLYIGADDGQPFPTRTLFRVSLDGTTTIVHQGGDYRSLVEGADGYFYGKTVGDGAFAMGTVFRLSLDGVLTTLRSLTAAEGPRFGRLIRGTDGYFYGTDCCSGGGGNIFRMDTDGFTTTLHVFGVGAEGAGPTSPLVEATDGNFYGTTSGGGSNSAGTVFRLQPDGTVTVLYTFSGPGGDGMTGDGWNQAALIQGSDGILYGSALYGIYSVTLNGQYRLLHSVRTVAAFDRYAFGVSGLVEGPDATLYGAARFDGRNGPGTLFRLNLRRSACANVMELRQGIVTGALKSELPAFVAAWVVTTTEVTSLWQAVTPAITPTAVFEFYLHYGDIVGVYSLVVTADGHVCANWTTPASP